MRRHRGLAPAGVLLVLTALVAGCGDDDQGPGDDDDGWTATGDPVDRSGLVWAAADGVVHLGDGSTIDTGSELEGYVVAGDGV